MVRTWFSDCALPLCCVVHTTYTYDFPPIIRTCSACNCAGWNLLSIIIQPSLTGTRPIARRAPACGRNGPSSDHRVHACFAAADCRTSSLLGFREPFAVRRCCRRQCCRFRRDIHEPAKRRTRTESCRANFWPLRTGAGTEFRRANGRCDGIQLLPSQDWASQAGALRFDDEHRSWNWRGYLRPDASLNPDATSLTMLFPLLEHSPFSWVGMNDYDGQYW